MADLPELEHSSLRQELHDLKRCQIIFLQLSVTATGILLGLAVRWNMAKLFEYIYLLPLIIVLPSWWIFFDKATTITRIVGYYRIVEKMILGKLHPPRKWSGWENSLGLFRKEGERVTIPKIEKKTSEFIKLIFLQKPFRYWMIIYYTFFGLSLICWFLTLLQKPSICVWLIGLGAIGFTAYWNLRIVYQLVLGRYSYDNNQKIWEEILK